MNTPQKPPSERQLAAQAIAEVIVNGQLTSPFGGDVILSQKPRPHYSVAFAKPRILDGTVQVFSTNFVVVRWQTAIRVLAASDSRVYTAENAARFIQLAFVEGKYEEAEAIPRAR